MQQPYSYQGKSLKEFIDATIEREAADFNKRETALKTKPVVKKDALPFNHWTKSIPQETIADIRRSFVSGEMTIKDIAKKHCLRPALISKIIYDYN